MPMPYVWLNGKFVDESEATISVRDAGFLHGVGIFTTMRAHRGRVIRVQQHLRRLRDSSEALFIPMMQRDDDLKKAFIDLLARNELTDARMRVTLTRGLSINDPVHGMRLEPTALITAAPFEAYPEEYYQKGITVLVLADQKLNPHDMQAGHKTLDYFTRISALRVGNKAGAGEVLWFNTDNYLQSGCISNVFLVKNGALLTPATNADLHDPELRKRCPYAVSNALPGTTRGAILEIATTLGIPARIGALTINDVLDADEVFMTNCAMGVLPVCRIERKPIGDDKPGPITTQLRHAWEELVEQESEQDAS